MNNKKILNKSKYAETWAKLNKVTLRIKDKYRGSDYFPIGTFKPFYTYKPDEDIPESEIYFLKMDTIAPNDATSMMFIGQSGCHKTTLMKTITYYNSLLVTTKILVMDLKSNSRDWEKCNRPHKNKGALYPNESATMNIKAGCPLFTLRGMVDEEKNKINVLNIDPKKFADIEMLTGLGFSPMSKQHLYKMLSEGMKPEDILGEVEKMYKKKKLTKPSYDNMSILLDNMIRAGFLAKKNHFDLNEVWDSGQALVLGFNNKEVSFLSVYVDKLLTEVFDRANSNKGKKERYWIIVDDCQKAFGLNPERYPSVQRGVDSLTLWRSVGINMVIGIQSPVLVSDDIYGDIKHFFIYQTPQVNILAKYIPNRIIIDNIKTLLFQPEKNISECIHIFPDKRRFVRFFPFNSPIAN